jgi:hypothetical protein
MDHISQPDNLANSVTVVFNFKWIKGPPDDDPVGIEGRSGDKTTLTYICIVNRFYFIVVLTARTRTSLKRTKRRRSSFAYAMEATVRCISGREVVSYWICPFLFLVMYHIDQTTAPSFNLHSGIPRVHWWLRIYCHGCVAHDGGGRTLISGIWGPHCGENSDYGCLGYGTGLVDGYRRNHLAH